MESGLDIDRMKPAETPTKFQPQVTLLQKFAYGFGASADMIGFHAPAALIMRGQCIDWPPRALLGSAR